MFQRLMIRLSECNVSDVYAGGYETVEEFQ